MKKLQKIHTLQHDQTDCGVACLKSVLRYYGGDASLEKLRELSGTNTQGTTLLGLQQAAHQKGLEAEAFEVDNLEDFKKDADFPCIFHVILENRLQHYVVCYRIENGSYLIGDPGKGLEVWTEDQLLEVWKSRIMLNLKPTPSLELKAEENKRKLQWFLELIKEDVPILAISAVIGILVAALGLVTAYFTQRLIDDFLPSQENNKILFGLLFLGVLLLARSGINYMRTILLLNQSRNFNNRTAGRFYDTLLFLPKPFFDNRKTGDLITRMNDTRRIQSTLLLLTNTAIVNLLVILVSLIFVFVYSWVFGVVSMTALPFIAWLAIRYTRPISLGQKDVMTSYSLTESNYIDSITGVSVIKSYGKEKVFSNLTKTIYGSFQDKSFSLGMIGNSYGTFIDVINSLMTVAFFGVASLLVIQGKLKVGEMMALITVTGGIIASMMALATTNIQIQEAIVAFNRMFEFTDIQPEDYDTEKIELPVGIDSISLKGINFGFAGRKSLLQDLNMHLKKGEITVLKGEVGSGKSVILNIIQRFYEPKGGKIHLNNNYDLSWSSLSAWRRRIGIVEQDVKIFNGILLDNITLGEPISDPLAFINFLQELGLETFITEMPAGLQAIVGESGVKLSGGQKQLVALARALYKNPEILLLDEPTAAMDEKNASHFHSILNKIKKDKIILMITHSKDYEGDNIYWLENGIIIESSK